MHIYDNQSLLLRNTFHIDATTRHLVEINSETDFVSLIKEKQYINNEKLVLGGGSNILFTQNFDGIVILNNILGKSLVKEDADFFYVKAGAGELWHDFVIWCIDHNYAGLENLSLIPGKVGASPMQNIGAYGVEIKDVFHS
jgi:UDP-N-acetylmuramate dehydrogenase